MVSITPKDAAANLCPVRGSMVDGNLPVTHEEFEMSKRARRRRARKGSAANHGRRPNS